MMPYWSRRQTICNCLLPRRVRLVKLTLHSAAHDWVDIDFRYDPQPDSSFRWRLPGLAQAEILYRRLGDSW